MTWLVTGAYGMLGTELVLALHARDERILPLGRDLLDVRDTAAVEEALHRYRPATVVNCAAWTAVDDAEDAEDAALELNGTAVEGLARACAAVGATLVQMSTDYVFDGTSVLPYPEDAPTAPINVYGRTKLAGERAALAVGDAYVVRTEWLYGAHGSNFVRTMARLAAERDTIEVVDDQHGQPTWSADVAERIIDLVESGAPHGVYHATNTGRTTWHGLAQEVWSLVGRDPASVLPTTSEKFQRPAPRPANSVLRDVRGAAAGLPPMRGWREALHAAWPLLERPDPA
ncbi:dTDP-4-dehydrorhamnose reductase [Spirillospora sp. NPDC047279]|uniref:dTDP-4-dehydrorhamnose reductase n=1 Tax=Spirillospora sp. NPDC047279 TaxID=3155478 RepID=UPI0033E74242